jgi:hypothetical protein
LGQAATHGSAIQPENRHKQAKQSPIGIETVQPERIGPGRALLALVAQSFLNKSEYRSRFINFTAFRVAVWAICIKKLAASSPDNACALSSKRAC